MKQMSNQEFRDSGQVWIGDIPLHWQLHKLGAHFTERKVTVNDADYPALSVTMQGIVPQLETAAKSDANDTRKQVLKGDFVINSRSDRKGSSGISPLDGSVSQIAIVLEPKEISTGYVHYLLRSYPFQEEFYKWGSGIVADLWSTRFSAMKQILIPVPPRSEQDAIVSFLDSELAAIEKLIEKQRSLAELAKERKVALQNSATTRGLGPNVAFRDTCQRWLPECPNHWDMVPAKALFRNVSQVCEPDDIHLTPSQKFGVIPQSQYMEITGNRVVLNLTGSDNMRHIEPGDFISHLRSFQGGLEYSNLSGKVSAAYTVIRPEKQVFHPYFRFLFKTISYIKGLATTTEQLRDGQSIRFQQFKLLQLPFPPVEEQIKISDYLERELPKYDALVSAANKLESVLLERAKTLISDAVTGKINTRGLANG